MFHWFKDVDHDFNAVNQKVLFKSSFKQASPLTTVVAMRVIKFLLLFTLLVFSMETCLVVAQGGRDGCSGVRRFAVILLLKVTMHLQGCLACKRCSASGLNCRYLNPYIKLKLIGLAIRLYRKFWKKIGLSNFSRLLNARA